MKIIEMLNDIANSLCEEAEFLRLEESFDHLSNIICISVEPSEKEEFIFRINVDHFGDIDDLSLQVLIDEKFKSVLGELKIKKIVCNGRQYQDGYTYYSKIFYI